jgi:hypothetical protein
MGAMKKTKISFSWWVLNPESSVVQHIVEVPYRLS